MNVLAVEGLTFFKLSLFEFLDGFKKSAVVFLPRRTGKACVVPIFQSWLLPNSHQHKGLGQWRLPTFSKRSSTVYEFVCELKQISCIKCLLKKVMIKWSADWWFDRDTRFAYIFSAYGSRTDTVTRLFWHRNRKIELKIVDPFLPYPIFFPLKTAKRESANFPAQRSSLYPLIWQETSHIKGDDLFLKLDQGPKIGTERTLSLYPKLH